MNFMRDLAHAGKIAQGRFDRPEEGIERSDSDGELLRTMTALRQVPAAGALRLVRPDDRALLRVRGGAPKAAGRPVVGILCEYTPRELIMAAGGVPVCLCGGSAKTIPAAEQHLPANLCPLIKSTYGYHVLRQQSVPGNGRPGGGRDHLRRQEEDVRADGRIAADVRPRTAAQGRRPRRPGILGSASWSEFRAFLVEAFCHGRHRRQDPRGDPAVEPRAASAAGIGRADEVRPPAA